MDLSQFVLQCTAIHVLALFFLLLRLGLASKAYQRSAEDAFLAECVERHRTHQELTQEVLLQPGRWDEFDPKSCPVDSAAPAAAPVRTSTSVKKKHAEV